MGHLDPIDYYGVDSLLSEEEKQIRDRVRQFVDRECMPIISEYFDKGRFPLHLIPSMAALDLFGTAVDGYGCKKTSHTIYGLICQELGRCDSGLRAMFSVQNSLVMYPIYAFGSEAQREKWLPGMARGELIGCFALSEPQHGSNPSAMKCRVERRGNGYVLNGTKMWVTNAPVADVSLVWAKEGDEIHGFLVEAEASGFDRSRIQRKYAYRTSPTGLLTFRNCLVEERNRLPGTQGLRSVFQCLNHARYGVACGALGSAIACFEAARTFACERMVFDRPIASYQLVQSCLARMSVEITKAQLLSHRLGRLMDDNRAGHPQISMAKLNNVREAMKIARMARDVLGARGILADHHVMRHLCDMEAVSTLEGTESMHTLILGQDLTGMQAFS